MKNNSLLLFHFRNLSYFVSLWHWERNRRQRGLGNIALYILWITRNHSNHGFISFLLWYVSFTLAIAFDVKNDEENLSLVCFLSFSFSLKWRRLVKSTSKCAARWRIPKLTICKCVTNSGVFLFLRRRQNIPIRENKHENTSETKPNRGLNRGTKTLPHFQSCAAVACMRIYSEYYTQLEIRVGIMVTIWLEH